VVSDQLRQQRDGGVRGGGGDRHLLHLRHPFLHQVGRRRPTVVRDSLKRETREMRLEQSGHFVCPKGPTVVLFNFNVCYLVVGTISFMHILLLQLPKKKTIFQAQMLRIIFFHLFQTMPDRLRGVFNKFIYLYFS
jgi:hypothetical protein